jgi:hypothetical protein
VGDHLIYGMARVAVAKVENVVLHHMSYEIEIGGCAITPKGLYYRK